MDKEMNTTIVNYLKSDIFIIIIITVCLIGLLICLIDNLIKRRENRQKHYVKKQINYYL